MAALLGKLALNCSMSLSFNDYFFWTTLLPFKLGCFTGDWYSRLSAPSCTKRAEWRRLVVSGLLELLLVS